MTNSFIVLDLALAPPITRPGFTNPPIESRGLLYPRPLVKAGRLATAVSRVMEATAQATMTLSMLREGSTQTIVVQRQAEVHSAVGQSLPKWSCSALAISLAAVACFEARAGRRRLL